MAEIKISELSIGDWVMNLYANKPSRVIGLRTMFQDTYEIIAVSDGTQYMLIEDKELHNYEPIPLTPEILEKNGWLPPRKAIELDTWWWTNGVDKAIEAYEYEGEWYLTIIEQKEIQYRNRVGIGLKYVHQLQHALRLAGVEKEIEV